MVITDDTGLHAKGCPCPTCEITGGPTPLERAAAEKAMRTRQYFMDKRAARLAGKAGACGAVMFRLSETPREVPLPPPYTDEQKAELAAMQAEFRKGKLP